MFIKKIYRLSGILIAISLFSGACSQSAGPSSEAVTLRMALIPVLDTLPLYVADQEGLFEANGVEVEFIPVASGAERDQLISAGQADGMINEVVSALFFNKEEVQVQIVRYARAATAEQAVFRILAAGGSEINSVEDLKGVEIGISEGTVIAYLTDRLLQAEGFSSDEIKTIAVPKIPDRMALLGSGELKAAMLPEPLSTLAQQSGARLILDDTRHPEYSFSTISFRKAIIDAHPEAIRAFLAAIEQAVAMINADPDKYRSLMSDRELVPAPLLETYSVPNFVGAGVPSQAQYQDVLDWAKEKGLIDVDPPFGETVTGEYLP